MAATYSPASGLARTYVNGLLAHEARYDVPAFAADGGSRSGGCPRTLELGHSLTELSAAALPGRVANLRVWNRELTVLDVQRGMQGRLPFSLTSGTGFDHSIDPKEVFMGRLKIKGGGSSKLLGNGDGSSDEGLLLDTAASGHWWNVLRQPVPAGGRQEWAGGLPLPTGGWRPQAQGPAPAFKPANVSVVLLTDTWDMAAVRAAAIRLYGTTGCSKCPLEVIVSIVQPYCGSGDLMSQVSQVRRAFEFADDTVWLNGIKSKMRFTVVYNNEGDCRGAERNSSGWWEGGVPPGGGIPPGDGAPGYGRLWSDAVETGLSKMVYPSDWVLLVSERLLPAQGWLAGLLAAGQVEAAPGGAPPAAVHSKLLWLDGATQHFGHKLQREYVREVGCCSGKGHSKQAGQSRPAASTWAALAACRGCPRAALWGCTPPCS